ncbi:hypothetical protein LX64_02139 [Chitinophaga skermanii]|uniref:Uncharacterized protein n=2 Tax=Chitinophaga skermanii TaxID=331697 RepID=A0A327QRN4_9BACT|nr:hypothetical protein LX64_02139 [Chitinophaga skermanii]
MNLSPNTYEAQQLFSQYCRDGVYKPIPGVNPARMEHYRRLVFNVVRDNLESTFPILFQQTDEDTWLFWVNDFFQHHNCQATQVWKMGEEFYQYALAQDWQTKYQLPHLRDLLLFEWTEMELYNMPDIPYPAVQAQGSWENNHIALNPEHRLLVFNYPVHQHATITETTTREGHYFVVQYREPAEGNILFVEVSAWLAFVLEQLHNGFTLQDIFPYAPALHIEVNELLVHNTISFLQDMRARKLVLGFAAEV